MAIINPAKPKNLKVYIVLYFSTKHWIRLWIKHNFYNYGQLLKFNVTEVFEIWSASDVNVSINDSKMRYIWYNIRTHVSTICASFLSIHHFHRYETMTCLAIGYSFFKLWKCPPHSTLREPKNMKNKIIIFLYSIFNYNLEYF